MSSLFAPWVPKLSNYYQIAERVKICNELLECYKQDTMFLDIIITGDESWFHYYERETKL